MMKHICTLILAVALIASLTTTATAGKVELVDIFGGRPMTLEDAGEDYKLGPSMVVSENFSKIKVLETAVQLPVDFNTTDGNFTSNSTTGGVVASRRLIESTPQLTCQVMVNTHFVGGTLPNGCVTEITNPGECCEKCTTTPGCAAWTHSQSTNNCYLKGSTGWSARDPAKSGMISGTVVGLPTDSRVAMSAGTIDDPWWTGKLIIGDDNLIRGFAQEVQNANAARNKRVILDPTGSGKPVIRTRYAEGCWSPSSDCPNGGGGAVFYAWPYGADQGIGKYARLEYEVYFPKDFPWVKGGKLPGLAGGPTGECAGHEFDPSCFTARLMWRRDGDAEAYLYIPPKQAAGFCDTPGTVCNPDSGVSFMRGAWRFRPARWTKIALTIKLNDVGEANGLIRIDVDGIRKIYYDKMVWRARSTVDIEYLCFSTFFGGSDSSWAPDRDTEALFRNFKIYKLGN